MSGDWWVVWGPLIFVLPVVGVLSVYVGFFCKPRRRVPPKKRS